VVKGQVTCAASSNPAEHDAREVAFGLVRLHHGDFVFLRAPRASCPRPPERRPRSCCSTGCGAWMRKCAGSG